MNSNAERHEVIVIGSGQCGLAAAHHLARRGIEFVVLEANDRIGVPGLPMPPPRNAYPTGGQMADYLESYSAHFSLPVRTGVTVDGLGPASDAGDRPMSP